MDVIDVLLNLQDKMSPGLDNAIKSADRFGEQVDSASVQASSGLDTMHASLERIETQLKNVEEATEATADATSRMADSIDPVNEVADAFGNTERVLNGVNDNLGVMAEQFGLNIGPMQEWVGAGAQVAGGMEAIIGGGYQLVQQMPALAASLGPVIAGTWAHVTALTAQAAAFIAANAPIIIIVAAIAALIAIIVVLVANWDTITQKVPALGVATDAVKAVIDGFVQWITGTLIPTVTSIGTTISAVTLAVVAFVTENWPKVWAVIEPVLMAIKAGVQLHFDAARIIVETVFNLIKVYIETTMGVIQGIIDVIMGVITGDWDRAWSGIKQIVDSIWEGIKTAIQTGWDAVKSIFDTSIGDLLRAVNQLIQDLLAYMTGLPNQLVGALGDLSGLLFNAGKMLIQGFIDGIQSMFGAVEGKLKELGSKAVSWKGPPEEDATMLTNNGQLLIEGLVRGIENRFDRVEGSLVRLTSMITQYINQMNNQVEQITNNVGNTVSAGVGLLNNNVGSGNWSTGTFRPNVPTISTQEAIRRYLEFVRREGDYMNDWLSHIPAAQRNSVLDQGIQIANSMGQGPSTQQHYNNIQRYRQQNINEAQGTNRSVTVNMYGDVTATNQEEAARAGRDIGHGVQASLRARGLT